MTLRVVLDAAGLDQLAQGSAATRSLLRRQAERGGDVVCAAVTLAAVCRGVPRTRRVEAALARSQGGKRVRVIPTDERLAKLVGFILHVTNSDSSALADAHAVAVCAGDDAALVLTSDPEDVRRLAEALPGVRITTRDPAHPLVG